MASPAERSREPTLEDLVRRAQEGERPALEAVVAAIQRDVFALALRFFWHPQDAEDATQEILLRIVTRLGSFAGKSRFRTWVYRVATNALLNMAPSSIEAQTTSFEEFGEDLARGFPDPPAKAPPEAEEALLLQEVRIGCTHGMLLCLDRPQRLAFIEARRAAALYPSNPDPETRADFLPRLRELLAAPDPGLVPRAEADGQ